MCGPKLALSALLSAAAAASYACGSGDEQPRLARLLAERLAHQSETVAARLEAGDACAALQGAKVLERDVRRAIAAGDVPPSLATQLVQTAGVLIAGIDCPVESPPPSDEALFPSEEENALDPDEDRQEQLDEWQEQLEEWQERQEERREEEQEHDEGNGHGRDKGDDEERAN